MALNNIEELKCHKTQPNNLLELIRKHLIKIKAYIYTCIDVYIIESQSCRLPYFICFLIHNSNRR